MLRPRTIPCLLFRQLGLVKTTKLKERSYRADPINIVTIFNDKEVDEMLWPVGQ